MHCSSFEHLLDAYLERDLPPRTMRRIADHLHRCRSCTATMQELRVVDALLATTKPIELPPDFAQAAMTHVRTLPKPRHSAGAAWIALAFYVICAWIAASLMIVSVRRGFPTLGLGAFESSISGVLHGGAWQALVATLRAFTPVTPLLAATVAIVLVVDVALAVGVLFFYRAVRPWLAARLAEREA